MTWLIILWKWLCTLLVKDASHRVKSNTRNVSLDSATSSLWVISVITMSAHNNCCFIFLPFFSLCHTLCHAPKQISAAFYSGNTHVVGNREQARKIIWLPRGSIGPAVKPKTCTRSSFTQMWLFIKQPPTAT